MSIRTRAEWNVRFQHWERPASDTEEAKIERAAGMVRHALRGNNWLVAEGVTVHAQGSYHNNTNIRLDADMDLRVLHPSYKVTFHSNVDVNTARQAIGYESTGRSLASVAADMRSNIVTALSREFGYANIDATGEKAIRVNELPGSRADVDVVPVFCYDHVYWIPSQSQYGLIEGVAILSKSGQCILNFPEQHYANGTAKRERTRHRFKRNVRILKWLRNELADEGMLTNRIPSFLIECLVYCVEDGYFLVEDDDRYGRIYRICGRLQALLADPNWVSSATEINEVKLLFAAGQPWAAHQAAAFFAVAIRYLEGR